MKICDLLFLSLFFTHTSSFSNIPQCFDNPVALNYSNTKQVYLQEIKIFSGYWWSQSVLALLLHIFLKEKIGFQTTFWPVDDPVTPNYKELGDYISSVIDTDKEPYWNGWIKGLEEFKVDILGEWYEDFGRNNLTSRYLFDNYINDVQTGTNVRMGFFLPEYAIEEDGMCPHYLDLKDPAVKSKLNKTEGRSKIPMWTSIATYAMVKRAIKMVENLGLSDEYEVVTLGSENTLTQKIDELYTQKEPFIAVVYTPHLDFSRYNLLPVNFPYNPSGKWSDPCFEQFACDWVDDPVTYQRRAVFHEEWPEVATSLRNLEITRSTINSILGEYDRTGDLFQAVCDWAKENEAALDAAAVVPERYQWVDANYGDGVRISFTVVCSFVILLIILFIIWYILNWNAGIVLTTSPRITIFWFIGHIFILICIIDCAHGLKSVQSASIFNFSFNIGFAMILLAPTFRSYRISRIFDDDLDKENIISTQTLVRILLGILFMECFFASIFTFRYSQSGAQPHRPQEVATAESYEQWYSINTQSSLTNRLFFLQIILKILYLMPMLYYANATRKAWSNFRETRFLVFHSYLIVVLAVTLMAIFNSSLQVQEEQLLFMAMVSIVSFSLFMFYTIPLLTRWWKDDGEDPIMRKSEKKRYQTGFHNIVNHFSVSELEHAMEVIKRVHTYKTENLSDNPNLTLRSSAYFSKEEVEEAKTVWKFAETIRRGSIQSVDSLSHYQQYQTELLRNRYRISIDDATRLTVHHPVHLEMMT